MIDCPSYYTITTHCHLALGQDPLFTSSRMGAFVWFSVFVITPETMNGSLSDFFSFFSGLSSILAQRDEYFLTEVKQQWATLVLGWVTV